MKDRELLDLDARTFQLPLDELADTLALKVQREGEKRFSGPAFGVPDIYFLIRQAHRIYELFFYLNADERRKNDSGWNVAYSIAVLPLVRCMIDCLYNVTAILNDPQSKSNQFRMSGYKQMFDAIEVDEKRYGGDPAWDPYIARYRAEMDLELRRNKMDLDEIRAVKTWPTLSRYLQVKKGASLTAHQEFLKRLTYGFWQEYSGMAHATFHGLMRTAIFYSTRDVPHEEQPRLEDFGDRMISTHLCRVSGILLCILTEVQAYFRFDGARINERLHKIWDAVLPALEIKELYEGRYAALMKERGIARDREFDPI